MAGFYRVILACAAIAGVNASFRVNGSVDPVVSRNNVGVSGRVTASHDLGNGNSINYGASGSVTSQGGPQFHGVQGNVNAGPQTFSAAARPGSGVNLGYNIRL